MNFKYKKKKNTDFVRIYLPYSCIKFAVNKRGNYECKTGCDVTKVKLSLELFYIKKNSYTSTYTNVQAHIWKDNREKSGTIRQTGRQKSYSLSSGVTGRGQLM